MQVDDKAADLILTIARLLAKCANDNGLSQVQLDDLNRNVEALIEYDGDEFVRRFLTTLRDATPDLALSARDRGARVETTQCSLKRSSTSAARRC